MNQFDIVRNKNQKSSKKVPFLINLQSDPMDLLGSRIVAPLRNESEYSDQKISRIHIPITVENTNYIIFISELAAIPTQLMGEKIMNAADMRQEFTSAIDLLFTGF
ncbi:MAG: CcdB family protein [Spirochaetales bacterium]|nr:CcdB family protein [Spirochaetales bacterium]